MTTASDEAKIDAFYRNGGGFHWSWPKVVIYRPADTRRRMEFNRYPHNIIGAAVVVFGRCFGVNWKRS